MENQIVSCAKCKSQIPASVAKKTSKGFLCTNCVKMRRTKRLVICGLLFVTLVTIGLIYFVIQQHQKITGFNGVGNVQEAIVVKVKKPEFSLSNIKAANNPDLNGTPIDNVESFRRAFDQAKRNSEVEYSSLDSLSSGNVVVVIPNIVTLFAFNSSVLNDQAAFLIKEYAKAYLQTDKSSIIKIEGFACNIGSDEVNDCISAERANAVKVLLVDMGVPSEKIVTASYGKRKNNSIRYDSMAEYRRAVISIQ